ncbi:hypothetical protein NUACC21_07140 [Scytonema sp. NUACC21]
MTKTVLVLAANPKDTSRLRLDKEIREIENGLQRAQKRDEFILRQVLAARPVDVRRAVLDFKPNIIHFCGHGEGEQGIAFENETGETKLVSTEALVGFFNLFSDTVECVVLNACYSEFQAEAIAQHINYVVGMKQGIGDTAAIEFAVSFYDALGVGGSIEFAYKFGCNAIQWASLPEYITPVLKRRASSTQKSESSKEVFPEKRDITGQWLDPADNDTVYFKQVGSKVIGFYDFGQKRKIGVYIGYLKGRTFEYKWRWLDRNLNGYGRLTLSDDGNKLSGSWWYGKKEVDVEHVGYQYISNEMPLWLNKVDFKEGENDF